MEFDIICIGIYIKVNIILNKIIDWGCINYNKFFVINLSRSSFCLNKVWFWFVFGSLVI